MKKTASYSVPALEKGLLILEMIAHSSAPLSLADLSQKLKKSRNELFRMLNCLESQGYLHRDLTSSKYSLSLKLFDLTHINNPIEKLRQAARDPMQNLAQAIRESCHLCVLHQGQISVVDQVESPERIRMTCAIGSLFDPLKTSSGKLLLSQLPKNEQNEILQKSDFWTNLDSPTRKNIYNKIQQISPSKIYHQISDLHPSIEDIVMTIEGKSTGFKATLAVTRLIDRRNAYSSEKIHIAISKAVQQISQNLGRKS